MRVGILVPTRGAVMQSARRPPVEECWAMARHADEAGYDAAWVGDSVVAKPRLEPLTTLAYLAAMTRGRVVLGLGVGWSLPSAEREWAACGMEHKRRVRRLEEHVDIWRMLWRGKP